MAREGTRSATGNSKPRVFPVVDTTPAIKRTTKPKTVKKVAEPKPVKAKPVGVTKKAPKKEPTVVKKVPCSPPSFAIGGGHAPLHLRCASPLGRISNVNPSSRSGPRRRRLRRRSRRRRPRLRRRSSPRRQPRRRSLLPSPSK
ncbi:hypothetical protein B0T17DRAFT_174260 [Bombardia bombarda]|uniref:Uncharacterized protein n=1 Tax=Bombardia bombarda TaxID=252184 RepID=A0AA40C821_9PEZI|nr:hypothetical protein B0T17DRAFT_174260 [Bombardia bombarda]